MKKLFFTLLLIIQCNFIAYCQSKVDKYNAINGHLSELVKDTTKTVLIIKEKISANQTLKLFAEGKLSDAPFNRKNGTQIREAGILEPLYNEKEFQKMRKKYQDDVNDDKYGFSKNANWEITDFKLKNICIESHDTIMFKKERALPLYKYETLLIALSDPIYYKNKNYLVMAIAIQRSNPLFSPKYYVIVMKKTSKKWQEIQRGEQYWFD
ncbi:hypothetical protein Flavo103_40150 [Flavobacterium collinsii]|uniref:hypothetical protein n=1 Tax=Flavobacterium collinsii TaxID=1114861 RepID=UPI0022C117E9|nr:hypothetical protein [Flavobacterium collinsii]GIQ60879.1 hypothetical protein Flavo103_40150 [Flavobacterium collinsii]